MDIFPLSILAVNCRGHVLPLAMAKMLNILTNSLLLTLQELKVNKLRTALSLTGVAFGIFCIIGVLATVGSLEQNIQNQVNSLGSNTVYIDKWDYGGGQDKPWWKMRSRPVMKYEEAALVKSRSELLDDIAFLMQTGGNISYGDALLKGVTVYGISPAQMKVQPVNFEYGRFFTESEFESGTNICILGYANAEDLFGNPARAIGRSIDVAGKKTTIIGVIKKEGKNFIGWNYDKCVMTTYQYCRKLYNEATTPTVLIAKGKDNITPTALTNELRGIMRQVRRLSPRDEDNFSLNAVQAFTDAISKSFVTINIVGSIIGGISLIVGMFGIANIMFVTVKERTPIIGLKKAIGAKSRTILLEFLLEAAVLCLMGGIIGLVLVYVLTLILSGPLEFPVFISTTMLISTFLICLVVGILAGIIPASQAAKMDPVVAIRSK